jgi:hypothetical protein
MSDSSNGEHVKSLAQAMRICRPMNRAGRLKITQTLDRCGPCPWPTIRGFYSNSAGVVPGNSSRKDRIFTQDNRSVDRDSCDYWAVPIRRTIVAVRKSTTAILRSLFST